MKKLAATLIALIFVLPVMAQEEAPAPKLMPEWRLFTQSGEEVKSSDYAGKPLILSFWATWCPHCKVLHPGLERLRQTYESQGLEFLLVSARENEGADPQGSLDERGIKIKTVVEGEELAIEGFNIIGTPTTFFIAPNGVILGSTMDSNPDDPRFIQVADYLLSLPKG
jgi:thiol-disulfide isomerase/thioredoxin